MDLASVSDLSAAADARRLGLRMSSLRRGEILLEFVDLHLKRFRCDRLIQNPLLGLPDGRILLMHLGSRLDEKPLSGFQSRRGGGELFLKVGLAEPAGLHGVEVSST